MRSPTPISSKISVMLSTWISPLPPGSTRSAHFEFGRKSSGSLSSNGEYVKLSMIAIPVPPSSFSAANSLGYCRLLQTRRQAVLRRSPNERGTDPVGVCPFRLRSVREVLELVPELDECVALDLADTLAADAELPADLLERVRLAVESVPQLDQLPFALR